VRGRTLGVFGFVLSLVGFPGGLSAQRPACNLPPAFSDSVLAARVMSPYRDSTDILAVARVSTITEPNTRMGVVIIGGSIYDVDFVALFANRCASHPVLRSTGWAVQLDSKAIPQWNAFMATIPQRVAIDSGSAVALGLLFLSFSTGRFVAMPSDRGESASLAAQPGGEIVPVRLRDVRATCVGVKCRVNGVWVPAPGVDQRFWVMLNGTTVETAILEKSPGSP